MKIHGIQELSSDCKCALQTVAELLPMLDQNLFSLGETIYGLRFDFPHEQMVLLPHVLVVLLDHS